MKAILSERYEELMKRGKKDPVVLRYYGDGTAEIHLGSKKLSLDGLPEMLDLGQALITFAERVEEMHKAYRKFAEERALPQDSDNEGDGAI